MKHLRMKISKHHKERGENKLNLKAKIYELKNILIDIFTSNKFWQTHSRLI